MSVDHRDELIRSREADLNTAHELLAREYMNPDGWYKTRCDLPTHMELVNIVESHVANTPVEPTFYLHLSQQRDQQEPYCTVDICGLKCETTDGSRLPRSLIYELMALINNDDRSTYDHGLLEIHFRRL